VLQPHGLGRLRPSRGKRRHPPTSASAASGRRKHCGIERRPSPLQLHTTGIERSPPASPNTTAGTSGSSQMLERGLAYASERWSTVSAMRTVLPMSRWWRAAAGGMKRPPSSRRALEQWFLGSRITPTSFSETWPNWRAAGPSASSPCSATDRRSYGRRGRFQTGVHRRAHPRSSPRAWIPSMAPTCVILAPSTR